MFIINQIHLLGNFAHEQLSIVDESSNSKINAAANALVKPLEWVFAHTNERHHIQHYAITRRKVTVIPQESPVAKWKIVVGYMTFIPATILALGFKTVHSIVHKNTYNQHLQRIRCHRGEAAIPLSTLKTRITFAAMGSLGLITLCFLFQSASYRTWGTTIAGIVASAFGSYKILEKPQNIHSTQVSSPEPTEAPTVSTPVVKTDPKPSPTANWREPTTALPGMGKSYDVFTGLHNPDINTCWLNAVLKFMAATDYFDSMFTTVKQDPQLEELRQTLLDVIRELRNKSQLHPNPRCADVPMIDWGLYVKLTEVINKNFNNAVNGEAYLAEDFLNDLVSKLQFTPEKSNHFTETTDYIPQDHTDVLDPTENKDWKLELYFLPDTCKALRNVIRDRSEFINRADKKYQVNHTFTKCPNNLLFSKNTTGYLNIQENGFMTLEEAAPGQPKKRIWYKVTAAIFNSRNVHFYCYLRDSNGIVRAHDDVHVLPAESDQRVAEAQFREKACVLLIRKFNEEIIR